MECNQMIFIFVCSRSGPVVGCVLQENQLDNSDRGHTIALKYPWNRHFYPEVPSEAFFCYVCERMWTIYDCYILHALPKSTKPQPPEDHDNVDVVQESGEDEYLMV